MLLFLLACSGAEKDATDTAVSGEPSSEASTEPSSEASTEPSGEDSGEPSGEPNESDFPELQEEFDSLKEGAGPMPMSPDETDNTTVIGGFIIAMIPQFTVQAKVSAIGQENVTCPTIEGTFPDEGLPTEDVIVTGNGCTDEDGTTYNGSFVYNAQGITYSEYSTTSLSEIENCDLTTTSTFNGGYRMTMGFSTELSYLIHMQGEEISEDCSGKTSSNVMISGAASIGQGESEGAQVINGEASVLAQTGNTYYFMDIITVDEVMDSAVCDSEPLSGTNTMTNGSDEYVFTFDGATDCDGTCSDETLTDKASCEDAGESWSGQPTQMLSINGEEAIEVEGTACSTMNARTGVFAMMFAFALSFVRRRRE